MIKHGTGGANTQSGIKYECDVDLATILSKLKGYTIVSSKYSGKGKTSKAYYVYFNDVKLPIAQIFKQVTIYNFLRDEHDIKWKDFVSAQLKPDDSIYVIKDNTFFIIEAKSQKIKGSTDEKLQTCDFKKKQWMKIVSRLNWKVEYIYILSSWFKHKRYNDVLNYIQSVGCKYYFDYIDLKQLGLPIPA